MNNLIRRVPFLALIFLCTAVQPIFAQQISRLQTDTAVVLFDQRLQHAADETAEVYPRIRNDLENTLGWEVDFKPTILLVGSQERFQQLVGNNLVVAIAVPQRQLIVIDYSRMGVDPFSLAAVLKHELCHLLLHRHIKQGNLPRWLDEGISQWVSDGIAEIVITRKEPLLGTAIRANRQPGIRQLSHSFPAEENSLQLAYEVSKSVVEYINRQFGRDAILNIIGYLRDGDDVDAAIQKSLSISLTELERDWFGHLRKRTTWFTYLAANLYTVLFFLGALISVGGFLRILIKKRRYEDEESPLRH
jgi:hypothetical protein